MPASTTFPVASTGELLRASRKKKGISLQALAQAMRVSHVYLHDIEHGRRAANNPTLHQRYRDTLRRFKS